MKNPSIRAVQIAVARQYQIPLDMITAPCRMRRYAAPRQLAMAVAMRVCGKRRSEVAVAFERNHKTIYHAERKFAETGRAAEVHSMMAKMLIGPAI